MAGPLLIRADAGPRIGAGHVMRCLALAQGWQDRGGSALLATAMPHETIAVRLEDEGVELRPLEAEAGRADDAERTLRLAREVGAAWVVVDGYHFDASYQRRLKEAGPRLLWIDDETHAAPYCADLVLNQNLHASEDLYVDREPHTRLLLGSRYVLLRREFRRWRSWRREIPATASKVLVLTGGADPGGLASRAVAALQGLKLEATVVVGHLGREAPALRSAAGGRVAIRSHVRDLAELMAGADLAISAAGCTAWELAFMGLPALLTSTAANQRPVAAELAARGAAVDLGEQQDLDTGQIGSALGRLAANRETRAALADRGRRLVDGMGMERILAAMAASGLRLRPAAPGDRRLLWDWANDPEVRALSFSSEPIPWQDHVRWFESKLRSPDCIHYLAFDEHDRPVGQVRFDPIERGGSPDRGHAEISVSIAREHRGSGFGGPLLRLAAARVFQESEITTLHAFIKHENKVSTRVFEKAGFEPRGQEMVRGHRAGHYVLRRAELPSENG